MKEKEVLKVIEKAAIEETIELDLSGLGLASLPTEIGRLVNLAILDISNNQLTNLPTEIGQLTKLVRLNLSNNHFTELPPTVVQLRNLKALYFGSNVLTNLPVEVIQLANLKVLDLSSNQFAHLPPTIFQLKNLEALYLRSNKLVSLPAEIGRLINLKQLNLNNNQIRSLPIEIGQLTKLLSLSLKDNKLVSLPNEIGRLNNLIELYLHYNQLESLPTEIGQLNNLIALYLSHNALKSLPFEIGQLTNLTTLNIKANQLTSLPAEIGQLNNLTGLYLHYNQLTSLPTQIGWLNNLNDLNLRSNLLTNLPAAIGQLNNLIMPDLNSSQLTNLPAEIGQLTNLTTLDLSYSQLTNLPAEIGQLTNLTTLDLLGSQLPIPPEILQRIREPAIIINYYLQLQVEQRKPLNEAKMLLVGQGSVGKTSLVKRLLENNFDAHENKTEGISIRSWQVKCNDENIRLNVWDFGGQEIMHATHQFFLTKRSLYLLVLDARLGEEENRLEYWLKIIQSFGDNSPVIVVGNKIDQHPLDIDRRGLHGKYDNIKGFIETSCQDGSGIDKLRVLIAQEVDNLDHVHDPFPLPWFEIKKKLAEMEQDYIPYSKYEDICELEGITTELNQVTLISFLHDLGIVLNFRDAPRLEETNVLNPEWITNGVYRILNDNALITQYRGILELGMLSRILDRNRYPRNKHMFILDIMRKFELCFPLEGYSDRRFLIPDLLSKEEPATGDWNNDTLAFQYQYNVLPGSIISRFIVRMHHYADKKTWWRSGIVLKHRENRALVKSDREDKKMFIWISGSQPTRRELLAMIRSQFDAIHDTIKGIIAEEKVPLPERPDVVMDYQDLLDMEAAGEETFFAPKLKTKLNVKELLDGVEPEVNRRQRQENGMTEEPIKPQPRSETTPSRSSSPEGITNNGSQDNLLSSIIRVFITKPWSIPVLLGIGLIILFLVASGKIRIPNILEPNPSGTTSPEEPEEKVTVNLLCTWKSQAKLTQPITSAVVTATSVKTGDPINILGKGSDSDGRISFKMEKTDLVEVIIRHPDIRDSQIRIPNIKITESDSELKKQKYTVSRTNCYFDAK